MAKKIKNVLFIMADQLRWDYLSCYGHPHLDTPNIDKLAAKSLRFNRAYVQSPVCGPSRASTYTGRTVFSHGATWNRVPIPLGEWTMGDYLRPAGVTTAVVGKTHMMPDTEGMERLGLTRDTDIGVLVSQPGFDAFERDDGLHPTPLFRMRGSKLAYNDWLKEKGYDGENPWNDWANAAEGPNGEILSAWNLRYSNLPARVAKEHSETAYMTMRAKEFIEEQGERPWLCHLSYIKPHWPYIAPAPYHEMYGPESFLPVHRDEQQKGNAQNPVYRAFTDTDVSQTFSEDGVREVVLQGYMGLIKEIDDHLGELFKWLDETGKADETMIIFTSDHGDYMGDHWMGEKELFHECSVRVPLIIFDPRSEADATRGKATDALVESIDLLPTVLEAKEIDLSAFTHRLEGRSLQPLLHGEADADWRECVFSEIDWCFYAVREMLGTGYNDSRGYMIRTARWKYIYFKGFPPQLFDLESDPNEFVDLGTDPDMASVREKMQGLLLQRLTDRRNRVALSDAGVRHVRESEDASGIIIGRW